MRLTLDKNFNKFREQFCKAIKKFLLLLVIQIFLFNDLFLIVKLIFNNQYFNKFFLLISLNFTQYLDKRMYQTLFYFISMIFSILQDAFLMHLIRLIVKD